MELNLAQKRFLIAIALWTFFGFVCAYFASGNMWPEFWWSAIMWNIVTSRMVMWIFIGCVGVYKHHPVFWFKLNPFLRWALIWAITSLPFAIGATINPIEWISAGSVFWAAIMMWIIYGMIIDFCATKWGWEGKKLLDNWKN